MNETTKRSLELMRAYWEVDTRVPAIQEPALAEVELALATPVPLTDERWDEYFDRLQGPEGCDFELPQSDREDITWTCRGGNDKSKSQAILATMGLSEQEIEAVHRIVNAFGGHCDCEIIFNAAEKILPSPLSEEGGVTT
jgi:Protein of unknown function (DUF2695)